MHRLTAKTLPVLMRRPETSVVLFGDPVGVAMMEQAQEFAHCWYARQGEAAFGYADAIECADALADLRIRRLPTTLVLNGGEIVARLEGVCSSMRIGRQIDAAGVMIDRLAG